MDKDELLGEAKQIFGHDYYAAGLVGIEILDVDIGYAKVSLKLNETHNNALGHVMGGVYFTLADYAFAIASNFRQSPTVTQTSQIVFLSPIKGDMIFAEALCVRTGRTTCFYKIIITDESGTENAYVTTTGFILNN
ncbi:MAG: PaaI family thioesterase [Ruminococcaceae bacterium]|nr:PaaI family thioesterase [Oscillospiraceae bacterium]